MGRAVKRTLHDIVMENQREQNELIAKRYIHKMVSEQRYIAELWK